MTSVNFSTMIRGPRAKSRLPEWHSHCISTYVMLRFWGCLSNFGESYFKVLQFEPGQSTSYKSVYASSKGSDQSIYLHSLIRAFAVHSING